jgi:hypothetical protein
MTIFITVYELAQILFFSLGQTSPPLILLDLIVGCSMDPYMSEDRAICVLLFVRE